MKIIFKSCLIFIICLFFSPQLYAIDRFVSSAADNNDSGTLRVILKFACDDAGDDHISFISTAGKTIKLNEPLVIPEDCRGDVTIAGSDEFDTTLDGSRLTGGGREAGDSCILHVYSDGNVISNLSFVGNANGAGVCLFGRDNVIQDSRLGISRSGDEDSNKYGVVISSVFAQLYVGMDGSGNALLDNTVSANTAEGVWVDADTAGIEGNDIVGNGSHGIYARGDEVTIAANNILANGGCPDDLLFPSQTESCLDSGWGGGFGIYIDEGSRDVVIGGLSFEADKNIIKYNVEGGVTLTGDDTTKKIRITHNVIAENYGPALGIDLGDDGHTANDPDDDDNGPNKLLNHADHVQAFPLVPAENGNERFWIWGAALEGKNLEVYRVSADDVTRGNVYSGGEDFIEDISFATSSANGVVKASLFSSPVNTFSLSPDELVVQSGEAVTVLSLSSSGNTSEFPVYAAIGDDADLDGILDEYETGGGGSSDPDNADTDGDGLADSIEDSNKNGVWDDDVGETCAYTADSDADGVSDWSEVRGDGHYNAENDTNPLDPDSDGDGLEDGAEDKNQNGLWEIYLGETHPLEKDTDGDGHEDGDDNCPSVYNINQEEWYCQG